MTNDELKAQIDSQITNETSANAITPTEVGTNIKLVVDYVDQQSPSKTSGAMTLSLTPQELIYDINSCTYGGGIAYLPDKTIIGKEIIVISVGSEITIRANNENTNKMFETFNTFISNVTISDNQIYRFTYIGFGTGIGGLLDGYWKAEQI